MSPSYFILKFLMKKSSYVCMSLGLLFVKFLIKDLMAGTEI